MQCICCTCVACFFKSTEKWSCVPTSPSPACGIASSCLRKFSSHLSDLLDKNLQQQCLDSCTECHMEESFVEMEQLSSRSIPGRAMYHGCNPKLGLMLLCCFASCATLDTTKLCEVNYVGSCIYGASCVGFTPWASRSHMCHYSQNTAHLVFV